MKDYETTRMEEDRQTRDDYCQAEDRYCEPPDAYCDEPEEVLTSDYQEGLARGIEGDKMKTPEELAEEYCASAHEKDAFLTGHKIGFAEGRAGYEAAQEQQLDLPETIAVGKWVYKLVKES